MPTAGADDVRRLPSGSHGIPADVVARNQRERLVAAMSRGMPRSSGRGRSGPRRLVQNGPSPP